MALFYHLLYILALLISLTEESSLNMPSQCGSLGDRSTPYLDAAVDMISKAKTFLPLRTPPTALNSSTKLLDCADALRNGRNSSGVYTVWPRNRVTDGIPIQVYCDMETDGGGWTVLQRRGNFNRSKDFFFKDWASYKTGFGNIEQDFWLGNDYLFALSNQKLYSLRVDMKDVAGEKRYALYDSFWIDDETNKYALHVQDYSGDAGDSMTPHNSHKFSTKDQDNDSQKDEKCAELYKGGWWYYTCHVSNLNGLYLRGKHDSFADGVNWKEWKGYHESLDTTEMKIRPKKFVKSVNQAKKTDVFVGTPEFR